MMAASSITAAASDSATATLPSTLEPSSRNWVVVPISSGGSTRAAEGAGGGAAGFAGFAGAGFCFSATGVAETTFSGAGAGAGVGGRRTGAEVTNSEDISDSIASILSAVASAAWVSRLALDGRVVVRLLPVLFFEEEDFAGEGRFGRAEALSSGAASRRSFLPKSENIPTVSLSDYACATPVRRR
jgi:hypothetical protein